MAGDSLLNTKPGLADRIIDSLAHGLFDKQVAELNGISPRTLFNWLDRGDGEDAVEPFKSFAERYQARCAEIEQEAVAMIKAAGEPAQSEEEKALRGDWKATAWWLERWRPLRWGTRVIDPGVADTWQRPQRAPRKQRAEEVFRNAPPELLKAIDAAGKMLVDKPVAIETTGFERKP